MRKEAIAKQKATLRDELNAHGRAITTTLLAAAPATHPYKGALEDLRDINEYSRADSHAAVEGNPAEETTDEELKGFCRKVLNLTRGM